MDERAHQPDLDDAPLHRMLGCRGCGYNLRGLAIGGDCPECGLPIWTTVLSVVDPKASALAQIRRPRLVGSALVAVVGLLFLASLAASILFVSATILWPEERPRYQLWSLFAGLLAFAAVPALALAPPRSVEASDARVRRHVLHLSVALLACGGCLYAIRALDGRAVIVVPGVIAYTTFCFALFALRRVIWVVGDRSRQFRTARGGRQRIRELVYATVALGIGHVLLYGATIAGDEGLWFVSGSVIMGVSLLMLNIGLIYLVVNMIWVRRALRNPPPTLRDLLEAPSRDDDESEVEEPASCD